mmetsp:Transcript_4009/g.355  ORF Transcript_4009/g.355 Transcript_4009/m.355 type:complete len:86 (+) Transcript_4009:575-832(+)
MVSFKLIHFMTIKVIINIKTIDKVSNFTKLVFLKQLIKVVINNYMVINNFKNMVIIIIREFIKLSNTIPININFIVICFKVLGPL